MPAFFDELKDVRAALAKFQMVKHIFDEAAAVQVVDNLTDGKTKSAVQIATEMISYAKEHHVVIEAAMKELADPKTASTEAERLLGYINDHSSELGKFVEQAKEVAGAEFELISGAIATVQAAK